MDDFPNSGLIGRIGLHYKLITPAQLEAATRIQGQPGNEGRRLGEILRDLGVVSEDQLDKLLRLQQAHGQQASRSRPRLEPIDAERSPPATPPLRATGAATDSAGWRDLAKPADFPWDAGTVATKAGGNGFEASVSLVTLWVVLVNVLLWRAIAGRTRLLPALGALLLVLVPWLWGQRVLQATAERAGQQDGDRRRRRRMAGTRPRRFRLDSRLRQGLSRAWTGAAPAHQ